MILIMRVASCHFRLVGLFYNIIYDFFRAKVKTEKSVCLLVVDISSYVCSYMNDFLRGCFFTNSIAVIVKILCFHAVDGF